MYTLITADGGSSEDRKLTGIGTLHETHFAVYGEGTDDREEIVVQVECLVGSREGELLNTPPIELELVGTGVESRWYFYRSLHLVPGTWTMRLVDEEGVPLPGTLRTVRIVERK